MQLRPPCTLFALRPWQLVCTACVRKSTPVHGYETKSRSEVIPVDVRYLTELNYVWPGDCSTVLKERSKRWKMSPAACPSVALRLGLLIGGDWISALPPEGQHSLRLKGSTAREWDLWKGALKRREGKMRGRPK